VSLGILEQSALRIAVSRVSLWFTFSMQFFGVAEWRLGMGTGMDSTAFHELIAQVRGTATALAEAEQKVAAVKTELSQQQKHGAQIDASSSLLRAAKPIPKRVSSGWLPAG
jgi:hypothetical protein